LPAVKRERRFIRHSSRQSRVYTRLSSLHLTVCKVRYLLSTYVTSVDYISCYGDDSSVTSWRWLPYLPSASEWPCTSSKHSRIKDVQGGGVGQESTSECLPAGREIWEGDLPCFIAHRRRIH